MAALNAYYDSITLIGYRDREGTTEVLCELAQMHDISRRIRSAVLTLTASTAATRSTNVAPEMVKDQALWRAFLTCFDEHLQVEFWMHIASLTSTMPSK